MVTIRCLAYNHAPYIRQCLDGFIMQKTNFRFEAIIHDDASTDGTANIIKEYAEKYPDIIKPIFQKENQYSKGNDYIIRRMLDEHTHGKYVAYCEGDDYRIDPLKLQKQVDFLEKNPNISYLFTGRIIKNEMSGTCIKQTYKIRKYDTHDIISGFNPGVQNVCFKRECLDIQNELLSNGIHDINGDRLIPYCASTIGIITCINDTTAVYRMTGKGISTSIKKEEWFKHASIDFYCFYKQLGKGDIKAYLKGEAKYLSSFLRSNNMFISNIKSSYIILKEINPQMNITNYTKILWYVISNKFSKVFNKSDIYYTKYNIEIL